ncbi:MAG: SAM-dependent chlorinase/fluorinase [Rhodocyclaceae bacterium]|nr:SAM-dependent chlorinase/fluorinase [Rhodocyclaceae bacterium]MBX3669920.1 SAM-dependent chlorinase/fluorinase [Rhodocyclaceae bacterium]
MIVLFTDFGTDDIYVGQVKAALLKRAPQGTAVVDLLHTVPNFDARAGAHLLAALYPFFPAAAVFMAVVDPGVGSARDAVAMHADGRWFVGPDNGLLSVVAARAPQAQLWRITGRAEDLSVSFHGRDLFAPMVADIAGGQLTSGCLQELPALSVQFGPDDCAEIIYIDHYGNALTGLRAESLARDTRLGVGDVSIAYARVFAEVPAGEVFWYANSVGLVEIAVNRGNAARALGLAVGDSLTLKRS